MRPIKFRAWHVENKTMVNFDMEKVIKDQYQQAHLCTLIAGTHPDGHLMQFTGLTDKNGVDIYEGDIVKVKVGVTSSDINYWSVEHVDHLAYCGFKFYGIDRRFNIKASRSSILNNNAEIIGNIYQSPELLESV